MKNLTTVNVIIVALLSFSPTSIESAERPNIVFCFADDWGRYASAYAKTETRPSPNQVVRTPHLDRLASRGTLFKNAFVNAPSCTPCRSALLSGRYFFNTGRGAILVGAQWDPQIPSFPHLLKAAGYHVGETGKVWSPGTPNDAPFGAGRYAYEQSGNDFNNYSEQVTKRVAGGESIASAKQRLLAQVRGNFDQFLAARPKGEPFLYWFGPTTVHRAWVKGSGKALWGIDPESLQGKLPPFLPDVAEVREDFADYLGEAQAFDAYIGELIARLTETGELDRTLIVVSGDHGAPGFPHGKCNLYDFGVGVSLLTVWPGQKTARVVDDFVNLMDLAPTFIEAGGSELPPGLNGRSLVNILKSDKSGQVEPERTWVVTGRERHVDMARAGNLPYPQRALRTKEFLYIRNFAPERSPLGDAYAVKADSAPTMQELETDTRIAYPDMDAGPTKAWLVAQRHNPQWARHYQFAFGQRPAEELYDLSRDPDQVDNVAGENRYAEPKRQLGARLLDILREAGDPRVTGDGQTFERPPFTDGEDRAKNRKAGNPQGKAGKAKNTPQRLLAAEPPLDLGAKDAATPGAPNYANAAVTLPDGSLESYFRRAIGDHIPILAMRSVDQGRTWTKAAPLTNLDQSGMGGPMPLLDQRGELHFVVPRVRGMGRKPNVDLFVDLYHVQSSAERTKFSEPTLIYEGYVGSLQCVYQLQSGRIVVPFGHWVPDRPVAPPVGANVATCVYSDDNGKTWQRSTAALTAPCHDNYNGNNYGACEPTVIELRDGRVWMVIRTQDDWLFESYSRDGAAWSTAERSRFHSSDSPAYPVRLSDGRMVLFWNNCEKAERIGTDGVYTGRDALHAAISADEGQTWRGFREVYRDATRNGSPPKSGDRGTAYPHATPTQDGKILLVSGQGAERRRRFLIDPDWLLEHAQEEDFASLDEWHLFKGFGKPFRAWRAREAGPELIAHPDKPGAKVLHVRRPDDHDADGATWNFPAGARGRLTLRIRVNQGHQGGQISLTDRLFEPCDDNGEKLAAFAFKFGSESMLKPGAWHTLEFALDTAKAACEVSLDGKLTTTLKQPHPAVNGLSYLRLRSTAPAVDAAGFLVESVKVAVE